MNALGNNVQTSIEGGESAPYGQASKATALIETFLKTDKFFLNLGSY